MPSTNRIAALRPKSGSDKLLDQALALQEFVRYIFHVAVLAIECVIELLHFLIGNLAA